MRGNTRDHRGRGRYVALLAALIAVLMVPAAGASEPLGPPASVTVSFSPSTIKADGTSTTTATATVQDAGGNGVAGHSVTFTRSDNNTPIPATDNGNGIYTATLTSTTTPGPVTVTATDSSSSSPLTGQGTLYLYGPAAAVRVEATNPPSITADGMSTATATAKVTDAEGDPVPGEAVQIMTDSGNQLGPLTDNRDGTYSRTITSTTKAGMVTVTASDGGLSAQGTFTQTAGPASNVTVSLSPSSIVADGQSTSTAKATVTDQYGNPATGDVIGFSTSDAVSGQINHGDGTYTATITSSTTSGQVTVTATDFSVTPVVTGSAMLTQTPGPVHSVSVGLSKTSIVADGQSTTIATATLTDINGNRVPGQTVVFARSDVGTIGDGTDHGDGTYSLVVTSTTKAGPVVISAADGNVKGTANLTQTPGPVASVVVTLLPTTVVADGRSTSIAKATVTDANGNPVAGESVGFTSDSGNTIGTVTDHGDGTYSATVTSATTVTMATITAKDGNVTGSAKLAQTAGPAAHVSVEAMPSSVTADGKSTTTVTATVTDAETHPVPGEPVAFASDSGNTIGTVTDHGDGTYSATVTSTTIVKDVKVTATDGPVSGNVLLAQTAGPAAHVRVGLMPSSVVANGVSTSTATATVTDAEGHPVDGDPVTFGSDGGNPIGTVTPYADGTYTATVTSTSAVKAVTITASDGALSGSTMLSQTVGPAAHVTLALTPSSITADGNSVTVATATVTDAEGHSLTGEDVKVASDPKGNPIGSVIDHGDGTYTARITSTTRLGRITIAADDRSLTSAATLTQTIGPAAIITMSLSPSSIVADGHSATTATATVTDSVGNPVSGDPVRINSDAGNATGAVIDHGNGMYTATIVSTRRVGKARIAATNGTVSTMATLTQTPGPAARILIWFSSPARLVANGSSSITAIVVVSDAYGHGLPHAAIALRTTDPGNGVRAARDRGNGVYAVQITSSTTVHRIRVTATDYSVFPALSGSAELTQTPGPPRTITLSFAPASIPADGRAHTTVTAAVTDAAGHPLAGQKLAFVSSDHGQRIGRVIAHAGGGYSVAITASRRPGVVAVTATDLSASPPLAVRAHLLQRRVR